MQEQPTEFNYAAVVAQMDAEEKCISRLEKILKREFSSGPIEQSLLGGAYWKQYGAGYWKKSPHFILSAFLAAHPKRFSVQDKNVSLSPEHEKAGCVAKLEKILRSSTGMSVSTLSYLYMTLHGVGCWLKPPKQSLSVFLKAYPDKFRVNGQEVAIANPTSKAQTVESFQTLLKELEDKLAPTGFKKKQASLATPATPIPNDEAVTQDDVEDEDSETQSIVSLASSIYTPVTPRTRQDESFSPLSAANRAVRQESLAANTVNIRLTDLENPAHDPNHPENLNSPWSASASQSDAPRFPNHSVHMDRPTDVATPITRSGNYADNRRESGGLPLDSSKLDEIEESTSARLERKRMDFRERIRHCDASVQADMLERLLGLERSRNKELNERIKEGEGVIGGLRARIEELEEMLVLEGSLRALDNRR